MSAFGAELRRLRLQADLSLAQLAAKVPVSKSHLSRIETGGAKPSRNVARRCDSALRADGALVALLVEPAQPMAVPDPRRASRQRPAHQPIWAADEDPHGPSWDSLRHLADDLMSIITFEDQFGQLRRMGQVGRSDLIGLLVIQQAEILADAALARGEHRERLSRLASRYYEFAGWMGQESGSNERAIRLTRRAVRLAQAGGDSLMPVHALLRLSLIALYDNQPRQVIELSERVRKTPDVPAWLRGLAFQREAQGQALVGDYHAVRWALDQAVGLPRQAPDGGTSLQLGATAVADPVAMTTGWCLSDLGRASEAAEILDREVARLPVTARRSRARFGMRNALAHALSGDFHRACEVADTVLPDALAIGSATVRHDVKRLNTTINRWHRQQSVRDLLPRLAAVLGATTATAD